MYRVLSSWKNEKNVEIRLYYKKTEIVFFLVKETESEQRGKSRRKWKKIYFWFENGLQRKTLIWSRERNRCCIVLYYSVSSWRFRFVESKENRILNLKNLYRRFENLGSTNNRESFGTNSTKQIEPWENNKTNDTFLKEKFSWNRRNSIRRRDCRISDIEIVSTRMENSFRAKLKEKRRKTEKNSFRRQTKSSSNFFLKTKRKATKSNANHQSKSNRII